MTTRTVSLVIPGRNCAATIGQCLDAVTPMLARESARLREIIFVDDGSTDGTAAIVDRRPVTRLAGEGRGPGAARNLGWRAAAHPLVWFVDADCVAEPDALDVLLPHLDDPDVAAVSGSYGIMNRSSRLACLIHEEIVERHVAMRESVDFLATFNVLYRREVLERLDGFDERYLKGQDAELSFRVKEAGHVLHFDIGSRVRHFHAEHWRRYLRTQRQQGYWRVWLHLEHAGHAGGDSYSGALDHVQPPLAMLVLGTSPLLLAPLLSLPAGWGWLAAVPVTLLVALVLAPIPMTHRIVRRTRRSRDVLFAWLSVLRSFWRGVGMTAGTLRYVLGGRRGPG